MQELAKVVLRLRKASAADICHGVELLGFAAPLRGWIAKSASDQALALQALEGSVEGAGCNGSSCTGGDLLPNADPVCEVLESQDSQEDDLFEFAEGHVAVHNNCNVVVIREACQGGLSRSGDRAEVVICRSQAGGSGSLRVGV